MYGDVHIRSAVLAGAVSSGHGKVFRRPGMSKGPTRKGTFPAKAGVRILIRHEAAALRKQGQRVVVVAFEGVAQVRLLRAEPTGVREPGSQAALNSHVLPAARVVPGFGVAL